MATTIKRIALASFFLILFAFLSVSHQVHAQFHSPSNTVGVHLISPSHEDLEKACDMVGPWGWVVLVLPEGEYTSAKLQDLHTVARDKKCLIFHRVATRFNPGMNAWERPTDETTRRIANLCKDITPSSKYFYLSLGNEVNRGDEFGGSVDPKTYAQWAQHAKEIFAKECPNAVITLAALDKAAPDSGSAYMSAARFYRQMIEAVPEIFNDINALATHDYSPNMTGSCLTSGQRSIVGFQWEKNLLKNIGVSHADNMKVFITESGWRVGSGGIDESDASKNTACAYNIINNDPNVMMRSHFAFKFCGEPFSAFSAINCSSNSPNQIGQTIHDLPKKQSEPEHEYKATTLANLVKNIVENQERTFDIKIINKSTDNFRRGEYSLALLGSSFKHSFSDFDMIRPKQTLDTTFTINPGKTVGCPTLRVGMFRNNNVILELFDWQVCIHACPKFTLTDIKKPIGTANQVSAEVQFYDEEEQLVTRHREKINNGELAINCVEKVNFDHVYRGVLLIPGSLPQQWYTQFKPGENIQQANTVWPIDRNKDGQFTLNDILNLYSSKKN